MGGEALVLGIVGMLTWLIPFFGLPIPIIGLVWGIIALRKKPANKWLATSGVVLCSIGLVLSAGYSAISVFVSNDPPFTASDDNGYTYTPPPPTSPDPGSVEWSADGVITQGEYTNSKQFGERFYLYWNSDGEYIYIAMVAETTGWVALGIPPYLTSENVDLILGFVSGGRTTIYDLFSAQYPEFRPQDIELGGSDDIIEFGGSEGAEIMDESTSDEDEGVTRTIIEFKRRLNTYDQYDQPLLEGANIIIWAYSSADTRDAPVTEWGFEVIEIE